MPSYYGCILLYFSITASIPVRQSLAVVPTIHRVRLSICVGAALQTHGRKAVERRGRPERFGRLGGG